MSFKFIRAKNDYWLIAVDFDFSAMDRHDRNVLHCALKEIEKKLEDYERTTDTPILIWRDA